jgi:hypothetical protein
LPYSKIIGTAGLFLEYFPERILENGMGFIRHQRLLTATKASAAECSGGSLNTPLHRIEGIIAFAENRLESSPVSGADITVFC